MVFLPLHTPILEPDLDLALGEAEGVSDLDASPSGQVAVEVELLLQLQDLLSGVGSARPLGLPSIVIGIDRAHMDLLHPGVDHRLLPLQPGQALVGQQRAAGPGAGRVKRDKTSPALTAFLPRPHPSTFLFLRSARESVGSGARKWSAVQLRDPEGGRHCTRRCTILLDEPVSKRLESGLRAGRGRQRLPGTGQPQPCGVWSQRPAAADRGRPAGSTGAKALPFE